MQFENSDQLCEHVAQQSPTVILSFSRGKDSLAAWLQLRRFFQHIVPVHLYTVPGLAFERESLDYYQDFFETKIYSMPHPSLYRMLNACMDQPPERVRIIEQMGLQEFDYDDLFDIVKLAEGLTPEHYTAVGVTLFDSLNRRASINKYGPVNENRHQFFPIYDWKKTRILEEIQAAGVLLPKDYHLFGRSFDGIDYRFLRPIRDHWPNDYAKIIEMFPMAEMEILRMEWRKQHLAEMETTNG
jgi:hypothetical protein